MEFSFEVKSLLPKKITRVVAGKLTGFIEKNYTYEDHGKHFQIVVNKMGKASAQAQKLRSPITTYKKIVKSKQVIYVMTDHGSRWGAVVGILTVRRKRLFLTDFIGLIHEVEPLCVLDFYVHESCQRSGYGKQLFDEMLKTEGVEPCLVAIDKPSRKALSFFKKHYDLSAFVPQINKFVVFNEFFLKCKEVQVKPRTRRVSSPSGLEWVMDDVTSPLRGVEPQSKPASPSLVLPFIRRSTLGPDNLSLCTVNNGPENLFNLSSENCLQVPSRDYRSGTASSHGRRSADRPLSPTLFATLDQPQSKTLNTDTNHLIPHQVDHSSPLPRRKTRQSDFDVITGQSKKGSQSRGQSGSSKRLSFSQELRRGASVQQKNGAVGAFPDKASSLNMRSRQESRETKCREQGPSLGSDHAKYSRHKIRSGAKSIDSPCARETRSPSVVVTDSTGTRFTDATGARVTSVRKGQH